MLRVNGLFGHIQRNNFKTLILIGAFLLLAVGGTVGPLQLALHGSGAAQGGINWEIIRQSIEQPVFRYGAGSGFSQVRPSGPTIAATPQAEQPRPPKAPAADAPLDLSQVPAINRPGIYFLFASPAEQALWALGFALVYLIGATWWNSQFIRYAVRAKPLRRGANPELYNLVENLAMSVGVPCPSIEVVASSQLNAYASGLTPSTARLGFTTGLLARLNPREIEAVAAHELTHILYREFAPDGGHEGLRRSRSHGSDAIRPAYLGATGARFAAPRHVGDGDHESPVLSGVARSFGGFGCPGLPMQGARDAIARIRRRRRRDRDDEVARRADFGASQGRGRRISRRGTSLRPGDDDPWPDRRLVFDPPIVGGAYRRDPAVRRRGRRRRRQRASAADRARRSGATACRPPRPPCGGARRLRRFGPSQRREPPQRQSTLAAFLVLPSFPDRFGPSHIRSPRASTIRREPPSVWVSPSEPLAVDPGDFWFERWVISGRLTSDCGSSTRRDEERQARRRLRVWRRRAIQLRRGGASAFVSLRRQTRRARRRSERDGSRRFSQQPSARLPGMAARKRRRRRSRFIGSGFHQWRNKAGEATRAGQTVLVELARRSPERLLEVAATIA